MIKPQRSHFLDRSRKKPYSPETHPWRYDTTLCIAAPCKLTTDDYGIVLASDRRIETGFASGQTVTKHSWITAEWGALLAGDVSRAHELIDKYRNHLRGLQITEDNIWAELSKPPFMQKRALANECVQMKLGMSYDDFLARGATALSEEVFREISYDITRLSLGCELIVVGFVPDKRIPLPRVFRVDESGRLSICEHFACIGSGSTIAEPVLYRHRHNQFEGLTRTLYCIYEAGKYAEGAPGVDELSTYTLLLPPEKGGAAAMRFRFLNHKKAFPFLAEQYEKYGPKPVPGDLGAKAECFDETAYTILA